MKLTSRLAGLVIAAVTVAACAPPPPPPPTSQPLNPVSLGNSNVYGNAATDDGGGQGVRFASVSGDGDVAAFVSASSNLVPGDTNGTSDLFVRVRSTGVVTLIADYPLGDPRVSNNGRYVSYAAMNTMNVHDRTTGITTSWPTLNGGTFAPVVPDDGSVAIYGWRDTWLGSSDGTCLVRDLATGVEQDCPHGDPGAGDIAIKGVSANGRFVAYTWTGTSPGGVVDDFLWDRLTNTTVSAPLPSDVNHFVPILISNNGRYLGVTRTAAPTAVVVDRTGGTSQPMPGLAVGETAFLVGMSPDGRYFSVYSDSVNLDPGDVTTAPDVFRWDRLTDDTTLISYDEVTGLSASARYCGFGPGQVTNSGEVCARAVPGLIAADTNGVGDAYLR